MGTPEVVRLRLTPAKAWSLVIALLFAVLAVGLPPLVGQAHAAAGNNGDVKIGQNGVPVGNQNDPHVACPVDLIWSGYGAGAHDYTITVATQSPTSGPVSLVSPPSAPAVGNFNGDGTTLTFWFDLSQAAGANHAGEYHVDININTTSTGGISDLKQKTVWLTPCTSDITISKVWLDSAGAAWAGPLPSTNNVDATYGNTTVHQGGTLTVPYGAAYTVTESQPSGWHNVSGLGTFTNTSMTASTHTVTNQQNPPATFAVNATKTWLDVDGNATSSPVAGKVVTVTCGAQTVQESDPAITVVDGTTCYVTEAATTNWHNVSGLVPQATPFTVHANQTFAVVNQQDAVHVAATKTWQDITGATIAAPAGVGKVVTVTCGTKNVQEGDPAILVGAGTSCTVTEASTPDFHNVSGLVTQPVTTDTTFPVVNRHDAVTVAATKTWKDAAGNVVASPVAGKVVTVTCGNQTVQEADPPISIPSNTSCTVTEAATAGWHNVSGLVTQTVTADTTFPVVNQQDAARTAAVTATKTWKDANGNVVAAPTPNKVVTVTCGNQTVHEADPAINVPINTSCTVTEAATAGWHNVSGLVTQTVTANTSFAVVNQQDPANNPPPPGPVLTPNLGLVKAVDAGNNAIVQPGQQLTYALTYSNTGNGAASGVSVTDVLPANATFVSVADGGSYDAGTKTATWTIGNVAPGGTGTVHWTVAVAQNLPAGSAVTNVAMIGSTPSNTITNPVANGDLTLGKAVDKSSAEFGDTLTYTLTAAATGVKNQTGVIVSDVLPAGTTYVDGSATCASPCTASYDAANRKVVFNVGNLAAGASLPVSFQVTVDRPTPNADGSIPAVLITNVGQVLATGLVDPVMSNEVNTTITAVLGVKITRPVVKPPVVQPKPVVQPSKLPFTGAAFPVMLFVQVGAGLALVGVLMLLVSRRRDSGRHMA